jgi:predicted ArsR family transcriptional regulator
MATAKATTKENTSESQRQILSFIKQQGETTNAAIAEYLDISYEAVRQQLRQLEAAQWVTSYRQRQGEPRLGRPTQGYVLTPAGDHLFPKAYDELAVDLLDIVAATLGQEALQQVLTTFTDENVSQWASRLQEKTLLERLDALKGIYLEDDPFMNVDIDHATGELRLVERNCPFLNVALHRPALCSVTVSTLSRLLGYKISRVKRFQNGDGRCVFSVHLDQPIDPDAFRFAFEEELSS